MVLGGWLPGDKGDRRIVVPQSSGSHNYPGEESEDGENNESCPPYPVSKNPEKQ